jgi:hypothetical protein
LILKRALTISRLALVGVALTVTGCGASTDPGTATHATSGGGKSAGGGSGTVPGSHPQVIQPTAGVQAGTSAGATPVGDPNAHAPTLTQVKHLLHLEVIAAPVTSASYIDPLQFVTLWERTDQGVDAQLPVGAPILAPGRVKVLAITPDWYAGQPLVYFELLDGPYAGHVQYVAEEITDIARPGSILDRGQVIARYAKSGTAIEYGWSTLSGVTLARATTGYEEGEVTPAGRWMRRWLNSLGANAGPS